MEFQLETGNPIDNDIMTDDMESLYNQGRVDALQLQLNYQRGYYALFNGVTDAIRMIDRQLASADTIRNFLCDIQREAEEEAISTQPFYMGPPLLR